MESPDSNVEAMQHGPRKNDSGLGFWFSWRLWSCWPHVFYPLRSQWDRVPETSDCGLA